MNPKNARKQIIIILLIILVVILLGHHLFFSNTNVTVEQKKPLYWVDTMEPTVHYPGPGKSHMGMELTPVYANNAASEDQSIVRISPDVINNLGVRTAPVIQGSLAQSINTVGYVTPNENKISHIHTYADGWIRNLLIKSSGEPVKKGQLLLQLYSPMLVNAEEEYLIALASSDRDLITASYKKLQALQIAQSQIQELKTTRKASQLINIYSPQDGIVAVLNVREGMQVTPDKEIMSLADLSTIWVIAQIFEDQAAWVKAGEPAEIQVSAFPGKVWHGMVDYIYPQVDPTTRTLKVRFRFDNPGNLLKPDMYATITLQAQPKQNVLTIPLEALIRSGQGDRVVVALGNGRFQVREVVAGLESGNQVEILSGLQANESVVISGQFLLDSEANLKAGSERLSQPTENAKQETAP